MSKRMIHLLNVAADKFDEISNPFDHSVLVEHNVTLDECHDLSTGIASIIRCYISAPPELRAKMITAYAFKEMGGDVDACMSVIDRDVAMKRAIAELKEINAKRS